MSETLEIITYSLTAYVSLNTGVYVYRVITSAALSVTSE